MPALSRRRISALLAVGLGLLSHVAGAVRWPEPLAPKDARVVIVAADMSFNGAPMKTWELTVPGSPSAVLDFYRSRWGAVQRTGAPGYQIAQLPGWTVMSRLEGDFFITVQFPQTEAPQTEAILGVTHVRGFRTVELGHGVPRLARAVVINDIKADDGVKHSRTLLIRSDRSLTENYHFYRRYFTERGYKTPAGHYPEPRGGRFAVMLNKGREEVSLTLSRIGRSTDIVWVSVGY